MAASKWRPRVVTSTDRVELVAFAHGTPVEVEGDWLVTVYNGIEFRAYSPAPREVAS